MIFLIALACIWILKTILWICYSIFYGFRVFVWSRFKTINLVKRYGEYVVITGATDGIGLAMAKQFAKRGHSLVIIGRNEAKLKNTKDVLEKLIYSGRSVMTIVADLSTADQSIYRNIQDSLKEIKSKIGILVNNAGVFTERPDRFLDTPEKDILDTVNVNCKAVLMITRAVMPYMVVNKRGIVVNVGSFASLKPTPLFNAYSASKKFVEYFSSSLEYEYKGDKVEVLHLRPGAVLTKLSDWMKKRKLFFVTPTADEYAVSAIATIGRTSDTTGYWVHGVLALVYSALPSCVVNPLQTHFIEQNRK